MIQPRVNWHNMTFISQHGISCRIIRMFHRAPIGNTVRSAGHFRNGKFIANDANANDKRPCQPRTKELSHAGVWEAGKTSGCRYMLAVGTHIFHSLIFPFSTLVLQQR